MKRQRLLGVALGLCVALAASGSLDAQAGEKADESGSVSSKHYKKGELIVKFRPDATETTVSAAHKKVKAAKLKAFPSLRMHHVKLDDDDLDKALAAYGEDPAVEYAEPNYRLQLAGTTPSDCLFDTLWAFRNTGQTGGTSGVDISAPLAWDITTGSSSVIIAIIDTGVDYDHPDLYRNLWVNQDESGGSAGADDDGNGYADDVYGINVLAGSGDPLDDHGHGTHVAGIIGATANDHGVVGLNWQVKMISCKAFDQYGSGTTANAVACLEYVRTLKSRGVNITATNNSWGGPRYSQALYDAINAQRDILFVAAAGNSGTDNGLMAFYPASYALPNVLSVAATDHNDDRASFSNYGRRRVHVGAPGVDIVSLRSDLTDMYGDEAHLIGDTDDNEPEVKYYRSSGTSMAAPFVTGLAALLKAQTPDRDWIGIRNLILSGGQEIASLDGATITGKRINAHGSMTCVNSPVMSALEVPDSVEAGVQVKLTALSINCASAVAPVTVTTDAGESVELRDDGLGPDLAAGDGIFAVLWTPAADPVSLTFSAAGGTETITLPLLIINEYLSASMTGSPYSQQLKATGGVRPHTWAVTSGVLPPGLSLDAATGLISGVPTTAGTSDFSLTVTDRSTSPRSTTRPYSIAVYWKPDLVVSSVTYPATASQGDQIPVTLTIRNLSQGVAGYSRASVHLSADPVITADDVYLAYVDASNLGANGEQTLTLQATIPSYLASGPYYIGVIADRFAWVDESDETNNVSVGPLLTVGAVLPDLVVTSLSVPASAVTGQQVTVSYTVKNQGPSAAGSFRAAVYLSTDSDIASTDRLLGSAPVSSLAPGAAQAFQTTVTVPADLSAGTYYIGILADDLNAVAESAEGNNGLAAGSTAVTMPSPDLRVTAVSGPTKGAAGQQVTISVTVENRGSGVSGSFRTGLYLSADPDIQTSDNFLGYADVGQLAAGGTATVSAAVGIPATVAAGTYYVGAIADYNAVVSESTETNNSLAGNQIAIGPDLVVTSAYGPGSGRAGSRVSVTYVVKNQGASAAGTFRVGIYLSTDSTITTGDVYLGQATIYSLAAGAQQSQTTRVVIPGTLPAGTYFIGVVADRGAEVKESNESNNTRAGNSIAVTK